MATVATTAKPYVAAAGPPAAVTTAAASQHRGADDSYAHQDPLTTNPVGHRREKRCEQRRGSHAGGRDGADRGNATVAERHDAERDHERALARPHRSERDLGTAQRPAVRHLAERARPIAEPRRDTSPHGATMSKRRRHEKVAHPEAHLSTRRRVGRGAVPAAAGFESRRLPLQPCIDAASDGPSDPGQVHFAGGRMTWLESRTMQTPWSGLGPRRNLAVTCPRQLDPSGCSSAPPRTLR